MFSLEYFESHGISLQVTDDGKILAGPNGRLNQFLRRTIRRNEASLIEQLNDRANGITREVQVQPRRKRKEPKRIPVVSATPTRPNRKPRRKPLERDRFIGGVGTELRALIPDFFKRSGCGCRDYAKALDNRGIPWCMSNRETIIAEAKQRAKEAFAKSDEFTTDVLDQAIDRAKESFFTWQVKGKDVAIMPDNLMQVDQFEKKSSLAVVTVAIGDEIQQQARYTLPSIKAYAERCGADLHVITDDRCNDYILANKFRVAEYVKQYDRTLFIDIDAFIRPTTPNIFETFEPGAYWIHPDHKHNTSGLAHLQREMMHVGDVDAMELWKQSKVRNSGVVLMDREHAEIWHPPVRLPKFHCGEQDWLEYRLLKSSATIGDLPCEWNCQWWWKDFNKKKNTSHIVHLAACKDRSQWEPIFRSLNPMRRIIVATTPRTGSSLLVDSLATHPWALSGGEAFHEHYPLERRWPMGAVNLAKVMPWDVCESGYNSLVDDSLIVYLFRRDTQAQVSSWRRSSETGHWRNNQVDPQPVEWMGDDAARRLISDANDLWSQSSIVVAYEDMIDDWTGTIDRILAAAKWPVQPVEQAHQRQMT